ncbi:MAG: hypothetical protein JSV61_15840 [Anaerolineales bacterium]|nr:MAG: hypothetical protein JSV61_15840 [Anaerolineales bacterium]
MSGIQPFGEEGSEWDDVGEEVAAELEQLNQSLSEIELLLEQSQVEVGKLAQKNADVTAKLQQLQSEFENASRDEIRTIYDNALEIQQRLFVVRGQVEKLQTDHANQQRSRRLLEKVFEVLESGKANIGMSGNGRTASIDMLESMIQAQESERQRLSRLMHDGPAQAMSNFILQTDIAMRLFDLDLEKAREELISLKSSSTTTFKKVREFIFELRPMMLDDLGLVPTLRRYIEAIQEQTEANVQFVFNGVERRLEPYLEILVFRSTQEILGNAIHHSGASQIKVQLDMAESNIKVVVDDDGKGFDTVGLPDRDKMGIRLVKERVEMLGGHLQVDSTEGKGTRVIIHVPAISVAEFT